MTNKCPIYIKDGKVIDEAMTNVEKILHSKKLNYKDLTSISDPYFKDNKCETINLYIDLFDVLKPLYSPLLVEEFRTIRTHTKMNIISEILNIVAHYRHFFFSRYGKFTTVILYYSSKEDSWLKGIESEYKKDFYNKRILSKNSEFYIVNKVLTDCLTVVKEYLNYIPHAYLIDTGITDPRFLPYMLKKEISSEDVNNLINPDDFTIIMSNNKLSLLELTYDNDNTILFKNDHNDKYYINHNEIYEELGLDNSIGLPLSMTKLLFAIAGNKAYGIRNVSKMKEKKAFKYLTDKFLAGKMSIDDCSELKDFALLKGNYNLINHTSYPFNEYRKNHIIKQFVDIIDFEYIKQETFNIFDASCVVLLDYLFDGEEF